MTRERLQDVALAVNGLLGTFAEKQKAEKPRRWDTVEYRSSSKLGLLDARWMHSENVLITYV